MLMNLTSKYQKRLHHCTGHEVSTFLLSISSAERATPVQGRKDNVKLFEYHTVHIQLVDYHTDHVQLVDYHADHIKLVDYHTRRKIH